MKIVKRSFIVKLLAPLEKEEKKLGNALDFILKNNFLLTPLNDIIINNNKVAPHYEFSQKYLNIPLDYSLNFKSLNNIRLNGHNFILANIEALRSNSTIIATLKL